jgi:hypothetical protein
VADERVPAVVEGERFEAVRAEHSAVRAELLPHLGVTYPFNLPVFGRRRLVRGLRRLERRVPRHKLLVPTSVEFSSDHEIGTRRSEQGQFALTLRDRIDWTGPSSCTGRSEIAFPRIDGYWDDLRSSQ